MAAQRAHRLGTGTKARNKPASSLRTQVREGPSGLGKKGDSWVLAHLFNMDASGVAGGLPV